MKIIAIKAEAFEGLRNRLQQLENQYTLLTEELVRDRLYNSEEVKSILGISSTTLQNLRNNGKLPFIKTGRVIRYRWADIEKLLQFTK